MRDQALGGNVVFVETEPGFARAEGAESLTGRQSLQIWHPHLDDETSARLQVRGRILKAGDLRVLGCEVHDRVEDQIGNRETFLDGGRGEVADGHLDWLSAWLRF